MTPLWREQAVHAIDVALAEAIYSLAVLPALIQRQTDVPASPTKLLGGADQFNRRWAEQYTAAATSLFGDSDQFSGFLCVRRLMPVECERLQGMPDDYTLIPYRGKPAADAPRYKAIGNSMAVPCMAWLGQRLVQCLHKTGSTASD